MELALGALYSEEAVASGVTTEKADMIFASLPYRILHEFQIPVYAQIREQDADFYARLEAAGFDLDWGDDESGLFMKYLRRGSGYYIDVGASELVARGDIKLAKGQVDHLTEDAVVLADGTELQADLVVYATGYGSMNGWCADLISQEVADRVGKVWGLGSDTTKDPGPWEGELRNMWKPTQQEGLWMHGGNLHQSRFHSLLPGAAAEGEGGGDPDAGVRAAGRAPPELRAAAADWMAHNAPSDLGPLTAGLRIGASVPCTRGGLRGVQLLRRSQLSQAPKRLIFYPHLPPLIPSTTADLADRRPARRRSKLSQESIQAGADRAGTVTDLSRTTPKRRSACRTAKTTNVSLP